MKISPQQYAQALLEALGQSNPKDHDLVLENFVKILAQNGDVGLYHEIAKNFRTLEAKEKGIHEVEVTFAREIHQNQQILQKLNEIVQGKVEFKTKIDEGIVGGVVVKVDDTLIDASVKSQLDELNRSLKE